MIVPTRKNASSWQDVAKTNPVALGVTHAQTWAIFTWEAAVADAIVNGSLRQFGGKGVKVSVQNEAIEIYTRNLFRLRGRGTDPTILRKIMETLLTGGKPYDMNYWFVEPAMKEPMGWPYYIPKIAMTGVVTSRRRGTATVTVKGTSPKPEFKDPVWRDLDQHPALKS